MPLPKNPDFWDRQGYTVPNGISNDDWNSPMDIDAEFSPKESIKNRLPEDLNAPLDTDWKKAFDVLKKHFKETDRNKEEEIEKLRRKNLTINYDFINCYNDNVKLKRENETLKYKLQLLEENPAAYRTLKEIDPFDEENWNED